MSSYLGIPPSIPFELPQAGRASFIVQMVSVPGLFHTSSLPSRTQLETAFQDLGKYVFKEKVIYTLGAVL